MTTTDHMLAKQAVELWQQGALDYLNQITTAAEGLVERACAYEDHDSVADEVRTLLEAIKALMEATREATVAVQDIALVRGLEVAAEALRDMPAPGARQS